MGEKAARLNALGVKLSLRAWLHVVGIAINSQAPCVNGRFAFFSFFRSCSLLLTAAA